MADEIQIVGGILSGLLSIKFDKTKVLWDKFDVGIGSILDGIEPAVITTGNLDKIAFDAAKEAIHDVLAKLKAPANGPLVVGVKWKRSKEEVEKLITDNGMQVSEFAPWILLVAQFIPLVIDLIKWLRSMRNG